jgi:hypothetical protein
VFAGEWPSATLAFSSSGCFFIVGLLSGSGLH